MNIKKGFFRIIAVLTLLSAAAGFLRLITSETDAQAEAGFLLMVGGPAVIIAASLIIGWIVKGFYEK